MGREVGQGAYGKVLLSKHKQTGQVVAVKQISKKQIMELGKMRSVFRERDLLKELNHQFIIKLLGVDMDDQWLYFIFEVCENGDLSDLLGSKRLTPALCKMYTAQMVQVLDYMQSLEVMHRDLKPQNIMLDSNWNIKFVSFITQRTTLDRLTSVTPKRNLT